MAKKNEIEFFGSVDRNIRGDISSSIPAWMLRTHIEELEDTVVSKEKALAHNMVPPENMPYFKQELSDLKKRLNDIKGSIPNLNGENKDAVSKARKELAKQIQETMPTLRDDRNGFVKPYDEYKRLKSRHIQLDKNIAESLGIKHSNGMITGDQANRAYKILSASLGEDGNVERLRRDFGQHAYRTEDPMTQAILNNGR